jgi:hypothetical protein
MAFYLAIFRRTSPGLECKHLGMPSSELLHLGVSLAPSSLALALLLVSIAAAHASVLLSASVLAHPLEQLRRTGFSTVQVQVLWTGPGSEERRPTPTENPSQSV